MGLNTVLVPAYWDLTEPIQGQFDFALTDKVMSQARENNLKVIFLWFGAWKNSMSCYAPFWFKDAYTNYPRAYTQQDQPLAIASAISAIVLHADKNTCTLWMMHIASVDREQVAVLLIHSVHATVMP